jgi:hypothetical protein
MVLGYKLAPKATFLQRSVEKHHHFIHGSTCGLFPVHKVIKEINFSAYL